MSGSRSDIKVVCFDLGGVVVRIARSWAEACSAAGVELRNPEAFNGPDMQSGRRELSDDYQLGRIDCRSYFQRIADSSNGLYRPGEVEAVHRAWVFDPYPGVDGLIERLNGISGLHTACLSNTNHCHWQDLLRTEAGRPAVPAIHALRTRLVSHELGAVKPDARIYALAEERLGAQAHEIVFFDDLAENVEAASRRGWVARQIDHSGDTAAQMREHLRALGVL